MIIKTLDEINQEFLNECILEEAVEHIPEQAEALFEPELYRASDETDTINETPGFLFNLTCPVDDDMGPVDETPAPTDEIQEPVDETPATMDEIPEPVDETPAPTDEIPEPAAETPEPAAEAPEPEAAALPPHAEIPEPVFDTPASVDEAPAEEETRNRARKKKKIKLASDIVFYTIVAFILLTTLVFHGKSNDSIQIFDYSAFTVLTGSMQRDIPQGSLVITKKVDPNSIVIGDDITYVRSDNATVTHRVVDIVEDYLDSGERGFQTKGVENPEPDPDIVYAGNLVGVVKITVPELGFTLKYISENIGLVFVLLGGILVAAIAISRLFSGPKGTPRKNDLSAAEADAA